MDQTNFSDQLPDAMHLAQSPAAKQLAELLKQSNAQGLRGAMEQAAAGNFDAARETINSFLATPEAQKLLEQLRNNP